MVVSTDLKKKKKQVPNSAYLAYDRNKRRGQSINMFIKSKVQVQYYTQAFNWGHRS